MNIVTIAEIFAALEEHSEGHIFKVSLFSTFIFLLITIPDIDIAFYKKMDAILDVLKLFWLIIHQSRCIIFFCAHKL